MCPIFLTRLGLVLGSQFIYMVGYDFPTTGSSQPDYLAALLCLHETPMSPLSSSLWLVLSLFSFLFSLSMTNPISLLISPICSLRLVKCSWLCSSLTHVGGLDLIIPDMEYSSLEMVETTLELAPTSKKSLSSDIPQGNTRPPRSWVVPGKYSLRSTHTWSVWAYLSCEQLNEPTIGFGLENVLVMHLGQGPMPSGLKALCRAIYIYI